MIQTNPEIAVAPRFFRSLLRQAMTHLTEGTSTASGKRRSGRPGKGKYGMVPDQSGRTLAFRGAHEKPLHQRRRPSKLRVLSAFGHPALRGYGAAQGG